jgi:carbamoyltransferase
MGPKIQNGNVFPPSSKSLGIHCLHDCSAAIVDKSGQLRVFELERFSKVRNCSLANFAPGKQSVFPSCDEQLKHDFLEYVGSFLKDPAESLLCSGHEWNPDCARLLEQHFPQAKVVQMGHHLSHCAGAYLFSGYEEALAISLDGGGYEPFEPYSSYVTSSYSVYEISRSSHRLISSTNTGTNSEFTPGAYGVIAYYISEIAKARNCDNEPVPVALPYAGKLMGLVAYGRVRPQWIEPLKRFYKLHPEEVFQDAHLQEALIRLAEGLGIPRSACCLAGQESYDLAATNQHVFEQLCFELVDPFIDASDHDVVLSGGCALNVLFNQKLFLRLQAVGKKLFVPPNPGDEGLSLGHLASFYQRELPKASVYCGFDILDRRDLSSVLVRTGLTAKAAQADAIVKLLRAGKIGGCIMGFSEIGPRALGNRSIICDPSFKNSKDALNSRVKFREWFRPFAPVCREEDQDVYFAAVTASPFMSFSPSVRDEFRTRLPGIVHEDGSARLQTISRQSHPFIHEVLTEMKLQGGLPVLLNTSFNIKGQPILTTVRDAVEVLLTTDLDFLVVENLLILK